MQLSDEAIKFYEEFYRGLKEYSEDHGWNTDSDKKIARDAKNVI